jgi:hypothetical protein
MSDTRLAGYTPGNPPPGDAFYAYLGLVPRK